MDLLKIAKSNLRKELKWKLSEMTAKEINEQSKIITNKVLDNPLYKNSKRISVYLSMNSEVQTIDIIKNIFVSAKSCFIPKYRENGMSMVKVKSINDIKNLPKTKWNISQPADNDIREDALLTGGLDLIILPGLGFSKDGKRIGRGKGYYDKCIKSYKEIYPKNNLITIGLAFRQQIVVEIPMADHDSVLDLVIYPDMD
ncbi:5-formyltetrahydrofolate cyclo-ligase [Daktulosphaira vitifoliae]|uniref:5-formyltetrahydrofolate cyclo-ligase n=1 Tax=Daktulosphaira vitifoliae TaxID=58002 RepID=UPI0021AA1B4F|nr:5-formyltetrahydrofolate cyclo-ligase [Daktulosphaira vitifoliae]